MAGVVLSRAGVAGSEAYCFGLLHDASRALPFISKDSHKVGLQKEEKCTRVHVRMCLLCVSRCKCVHSLPYTYSIPTLPKSKYRQGNGWYGSQC